MAVAEAPEATESKRGRTPKVVAEPDAGQPSANDIYGRLAAPFEETFSRNVGGTQLTYITVEQVISRLNEVLGVAGWSWTVDDSGINKDEDEVYVQGTLVANFPMEGGGYRSVHKTGFGGAKIKRNRNDGRAVDLGNETKGAASDALKKAAMMIGVGLYLAKKNPNDMVQRDSYIASNPTTQFPTNNSTGDSTTGVVQAKRGDGMGIKVNDQWYSAAGRNPVSLGNIQKGMKVTIAHNPGKTFINGITVADGAGSSGDDDLEELPF